MSSYDYDLVVVGAGSGGISAANLGVNLGKKVALVEKRRIGGECTWTGCVPSKALIKAAEVAHHARSAAAFGLRLDCAGLDASNVMSHVRDVILRVYEEERPEVFEEKGIAVHFGETRFIDTHTIAVGDREITGGSFVVATGSSPAVPPIDGMEGTPYLTNENLFDLETLPRSMIILGAGPIGCEMAGALNRLGVHVTVVQRGTRILKREEPELTAILREAMQSEGVEFLLDTSTAGVSHADGAFRLQLESKVSGPGEIVADSLLVAVGRRPNIEGLALEQAGVEYTKRGIVTDRTMRTTAKNIYAIGDVTGPFLFSHMAEYWAGIAVPNALLPLPVKKRASSENVPWCTFTDPELARTGTTEQEARERHGKNIRVYRFPYSSVERAMTDLAETGLVKIVTTRKGRILGAHILGAHGADLLHEVLLAKRYGLSFDKIMGVIHAYPGYADAIKRPSARFYGDKLRDLLVVRLARKLFNK